MILFYGKPGCLTNRKQIASLRSSGYEPAVVDMLEHPWQPEELALFFADLPVAQWFNLAAPAVKAGSIDPSAYERGEALARLVREPILIRRPLLQRGERRMAGFDPSRLREVLDIDLQFESEHPEGCSHGDQGGHCP